MVCDFVHVRHQSNEWGSGVTHHTILHDVEIHVKTPQMSFQVVGPLRQTEGGSFMMNLLESQEIRQLAAETKLYPMFEFQSHSSLDRIYAEQIM